MIVLKYRKVGASRFISHIDLLKHMSRIIRRAEIPVKFSQGFNPHALLFFSSPSVLGVGSTAEYMAIDVDMSAEETLERYNASVPETLRAERAFEFPKNPNIQGLNVAADYIFDAPYFVPDLSDGLTITYLKKDVETTENVAPKIFGAFDADGKLGLKLASGNVNLRPDRLVPALNEKFGLDMKITDVVKIRQYVSVGDKEYDVDYYLENKIL